LLKCFFASKNTEVRSQFKKMGRETGFEPAVSWATTKETALTTNDLSSNKTIKSTIEKHRTVAIIVAKKSIKLNIISLNFLNIAN